MSYAFPHRGHATYIYTLIWKSIKVFVSVLSFMATWRTSSGDISAFGTGILCFLELAELPGLESC